MEIVINVKEMDRCRNNKKIGVFLFIEEGEVIKGNIELL